MKVSSTLLEQSSASCQLRFNKVFLHSMIARLQNHERVGDTTALLATAIPSVQLQASQGAKPESND
jgi:hypothetical protein